MRSYILYSFLQYLFTIALKLKRNDRIAKLNWIETKVSYVCKVQRNGLYKDS